MTIIFWTLLVWGIAIAHVTAFAPTHVAPFRPSGSRSSSSTYCRRGKRSSPLWAKKKKPSRDSHDDAFDIDELRQRLAAESNPYAHLFPRDSFSASSHDEKRKAPPETVHCIFFQPGTAEQGMHSVELPAGSGSNVVLAFESKRACDKFASRFRDLQFFDPTVRDDVCGSVLFGYYCVYLK
jgi:hypothetical protein